MERRFLKTIPLLILIVGCQQIEVYQESPSELNDIGIEENVIEISTAQPYQDVWDFIKQNNSSQNTNILNDQVLAYMNMHLKDLDKFDEYLNDSYYFLYFVIQELEKNNLPLELAILPYIESNYDPFSISSSGAVGIWQFMPRTGRLYQLDKSWWNEDRHDPFRSTEAAVKYLKYLYQRFDQNIYHTLAAYNAGPSLLDRRINQNKRRGMDTDFWSLNVPVQTKNYVPKYIALRELILNSDNYGIKLPQIPYEPVVKKISIPGQVEVLTLSEYLDIKPELLYKLNAGYTKWASAPEDESVFYIPSEKYILFENEDNPFKNSNQINWISHIVQSGDSLWSLASKYDTEVRIIKKINYLNNDLLSINDTLLIPLSKSKSNNFIPYEMYIVSEGDTLWSIAKEYNIEIRDLSRMNSIDENSYLQLGQQLSIGNKNIHRNMESKKRTILYSVKQGDNLFKISELFDVSIRSIEEINNFKNTTLMPGQIIKVAIRAF
ncbi:MAG: LysM peptidoglycan-binding domain-containing protein [Gammaproteobacteria bacterium]